MSRLSRFMLVVPLLSVFSASSLSAALADDKKSAPKVSATQQNGPTNKSGKTGGTASQGGTGSGQAGSAADAIGGAVGGAVGNAVGGLLGAFGPK
jgi:hypothetical protein